MSHKDTPSDGDGRKVCEGVEALLGVCGDFEAGVGGGEGW